MKLIPTLLTILLGFVLVAPEADARGSLRGGGGTSRASAPQRSPSAATRSPMTGSKIQRPVARPAPKPAARPLAKPAARPQAAPASRPALRPAAKPATRPSLQRPSVQRPSIQKPATRPAILPDRKPDSKPALTRPDNKPSITRPGILPGISRPTIGKPDLSRPDNRPSIVRPDKNKPATLPGMVSYPNRPDQGKPDRPILGGNDRPNLGGNDRPILGGNVNLNIDNNFRNNNNFAYRPNCWGARPWWGAGQCHGWHHGHWNYGWNSRYYRSHWWYDDDDDDFARGFMWGIGVWSLGNLIYDMGYQSYRNPYPAPPVQSQYGDSKTSITYAEPVSVTAAAMPPGDDQTATIAETKSDEALERSRVAFKQGDYLAASKAVDEAISYTPGDVTLHEYRALIFFALGKYSDAAGVLNPVLASGPGWGWETMIGFYNGSDSYSEQLRKLESYAKGSPDQADAHFLLGYHYMVCGHMDKSCEQFAKATELQPADSISRQLRDLTASSIPDGGDSEAEPPARPAPVPADQLVGTWVSDRGVDGRVTFTLTQDGNYTWLFMNGGKSSELKGTYGLNDKGLLVLTSDDSQMVSAIEMTEGPKLHFTLVGAPDGDPGLDFLKK